MAYGLRPVSHGGYLYNTGGNEAFPIFGDVSDGTAVIGNGDIVTLNAGGGIQLGTTTPTGLAVPAADQVDAPTNQIMGVFVGCEYVDTTGTPQWGNHYPGSAATTDGNDRTGYVVTSPSAVFQVSSGSGTPAAWSDTYIGSINILSNMSSASITTGLSGITIANLAATDPTPAVGGAVRIIGVVKDGKNETSSVTTPDVLVRWADPTVLYYGFGLGV
ncbi:hypothetical protein CMI37_28320 [Candidatus Pacearchaeota archaeon]|nr:hypothetical protein [Candidatus Pacearchaeota archaeon]